MRKKEKKVGKWKTVWKNRKNIPSLVQAYPFYAAVILIALYFLLDYVMINVQWEIPLPLTAIFACLGPVCLYYFYAVDYRKGVFPNDGTDIPVFVKNKKKYAACGWTILFLWGNLLLSAGYFLVPEVFPALEQTYYWSQLALFLYIAPIMEEITFRYLLYDRYFRRKWGWLPAFLLVSLIFVLCHPVTDLHSLIIYYVPTILFFLVYHEFGLYGSIIIHMLYNFVAL